MTTRDEREEKKKRKLEEDANRNDADSKRLREPPVTGQAEGGDLQRGRVGASKSEQVTDEKTGSAGKDRQPVGLHGHYPQFDRVAIEKAKEELLAAVIEVREKALARENNVGHTDAFTLEAERTEDDAEKMLALPLRIEPMAVEASAAGLRRAPSTASRLQSPRILEQSSLVPQCAMIGAVAHPAEPETSTNQALHMADNGMDLAATSPNKLPTRQYMIAKEQLHCTVQRPDGQQQHLASSSAAGAAAALPPLSWDRFPNYLGEGVRSRLLSLASLHLLDSGRCPSAVKDMPSNSNKVLLGAAPNCELYQERVIRALAGKLGVPLLSVDAATLKLDGDELKEEAAQSSGEDVFEMGRLGMGPPPDPYDSLDDEDPYQFDRRDRDKDYPQPTPRAPGVSGRRSFNFAFLPAPPPPRPTLRPRDPKAGAAPGTAAGAAGAADPPGKPPPQGTDEKVAAHVATKAALGKEGDPQHASLPTSFIGEDWGALQERIATMAAHAVASLTSDMGTFQGATPPPESEQRGGVPGQAVASPLRAPSPHEVAAAEAGAMGRERVAQGAAGAEVETGKRGEASLGKGGSPRDGAGAAGSPRHSGKALAGNRQAQRAQQGGDSAAAPAAAAEIEALPALSAAISVVAGTPPLPPEPSQVQDAPRRTAAVPSAAAAGGTAEQPAGQGGGAVDVPTAAPRTAGAAAAQPSLKRNARVAYIGRLHPAVVASQDRLEAIESAISRIEAQGHSNARLQQYLPALLMRQRAALAAAGKASTHSGRMQGPDAPPIGSLGRVRSVSGEKVVVELDEPFSGGSAKPGGKEKVLFTCTAGECQQVDDKEDPWVSSFRALFDVIREESEKGPLIVSIKGLDRLIRSQAADHFRKLEALLAQMPPRCIIFACYCSRTLAREKAGGGGGGGTGGGGVFGARLAMDLLPGMDEMAGFLDRIGRHSLGKGHRKSSKGKLLAKMFPNTIELYAPNQEVHSKQWRKMVETDVSTMRTRSNRAALQKAMVKCGMACDDLAGVVISDCQLSRREVEQLLGLAVAEQLREEPEGSCLSGAQVPQTSAARQGEGEEAVRQEGGPLLDQKAAGEAAEQLHPAQGGGADVAAMEVEVQQPWILKAKHIAAAAQSLRQLQQEMVAQPERKGLKDVSADQYEKQLLSEVIPPEEINVKFDDIGALEAVKTTLHEVVILPLQRPELFTRGSLTKPTKGLLLFGPPGTGKTMLAKAVASESRAHFINVNMSAITSKWFGEGERLVRALFSLAHKLSPAVIFIDEIDSFLSKRGQSNNEHEALRKMKNEFMQHWDGLRTKQSDRVLVLAATNRPMDLDDAVVRRMPRRIFVPLPDAANRAKILQVILQDEAVEEGFSSEEVASWTEGYSGSDLKNLSIAAAYFPIRHFLDEERRRKQAGGGEQGHGQGQAGTAAGGGESTLAGDLEGREPSLRHISMADFKEAMKQVTSSVSDEAVSMSELKRWNDQYGEGGSRRVEKLHYFT